ncbi:hypothetical protein HU200_042802 [Digitaria exilis]|uniref:Cytochrome P450 n=1 Tax=Digitaria exilis TaxID=1010633 RepID=A0A835B123_9POAL|nr:hypothetical protein HU200_042802 [Digitaria exilis]
MKRKPTPAMAALLLHLLLLLPLLVVISFFVAKPCSVAPSPRRRAATPSPWALPVIGHLHHLAGALPHHTMRDLAVRHVPLMLLRLGGLPVVVASSAAAAGEVMRVRDLDFAPHPVTRTVRLAISEGAEGIIFAPYQAELGPPDQSVSHHTVTRPTHTVLPLFYFRFNPHESPELTATAACSCGRNPTSPSTFPLSSMGPTLVASRKRGTEALIGDPFDLPLLSKRGRRCAPSAVAADFGLTFPLEVDPVTSLQLVFPGADPQRSDATALTDQELQSSNHYIFLALIFLLPLLVIKLRRRNNNHGKNPPPGPWRLPVIGSLHHLVGALPHRAMRDLARRHGPLMLLRLGELPVVSPAAAREVMRTHDAAFASRPRTATIRELTRDGVGVAFAPHGERWRHLRKLCVAELLSARRVKSLRRGRESEAANLVASIAAAASVSPSSETTKTKPAVNVSALLATYVTDAVVRAVVGDRIRDRDAFLEKLDEGVKVAAGFSLADVFPSSRLAPAFSGAARRARAHHREMTKLMDGVIEEHRKRRAAGAGNEEEDLLDIPLDMATIRAVIITTATTLQWAMAELMRNPAAMRKAQAEVRRELAGRSHVEEEALPELRYLKLVLKETLRLHAAVPLLLPRESQQETRGVLGFDVPKGAMVLVNAWAIGRDAASWGADAEEFRPERFEGVDVDFRGNDFEFVPFGAGRRMCPGIALGLAVMELGLASLLFHFDWELPGGAAPEELDMDEGLGITARRKSDLWLHATVGVPPIIPDINKGKLRQSGESIRYLAGEMVSAMAGDIIPDKL